MSYSTIHLCANDKSFTDRVTACIAQEGSTESPESLTGQIRWAVAVSSDVEAAYTSALAAGNPDPGGDPSVITDGMILAHVQANWPADPV